MMKSYEVRLTFDSIITYNGRWIMYLEPAADGAINAFFHTHMAEVEKIKAEQKFYYLPAQMNGLPQILRYNRPGVDSRDADALLPTPRQVQQIYDAIFSSRCDNPSWRPDTPILLRHECDEFSPFASVCSAFPLHYENDDQFLALLKEIIFSPLKDPRADYDSGIMSSRITESHDPRNDPKFDLRDYADVSAIDHIAYEIQNHIRELQMIGLSDFMIRKLIRLPEPQLSPLRISADLRIFLPAYDNMEIPMPTLSKVVYFFFLRHEQGMRFKEMSSHRDELMQIYYRLSNRDNLERMEQSIDDLVDSTRNSINEKCSRIRTAFVSQFSDDLAHNYYITGTAGTPKRIILNRSMIIDEAGICK